MIITIARKPLEGTVVQNVALHACVALNVDACRIPYEEGGSNSSNPLKRIQAGHILRGRVGFLFSDGATEDRSIRISSLGRWPANTILLDRPEVLEQFPQTTSGTGAIKGASGKEAEGNCSSAYGGESRSVGTEMLSYGESGSAARFFKHVGCTDSVKRG